MRHGRKLWGAMPRGCSPAAHPRQLQYRRTVLPRCRRLRARVACRAADARLPAAAGGTGVFDDFQIGSVAIESVDDTNKGQCTSATANCDQPVSEPCTAQKPQESALSYWYNGANDLDALYSHENIVVVKDLPDGLPGGPDGYQRPCAPAHPPPPRLPPAGSMRAGTVPCIMLAERRARAGTRRSPARRCIASSMAAWCRWR